MPEWLDMLWMHVQVRLRLAFLVVGGMLLTRSVVTINSLSSYCSNSCTRTRCFGWTGVSVIEARKAGLQAATLIASMCTWRGTQSGCLLEEYCHACGMYLWGCAWID